MQDVQNIPNPDVNSVEIEEKDIGSHSDVLPDSRTDRDSQDYDIERPMEDIPLPPDSKPRVPIEDPPETRDQPPIQDENNERTRLV
jgi:hypothetical protein